MVTTPCPVPSCITISSLSCVCNPEVRSSISIAILKQSVTYNIRIYVFPYFIITASRHHHCISSHWFQRSHLQHHEQPRKRKRIVHHRAHLLQRSRLARHNRLRRHCSQTHRCLHLLPAPPAASLVDEMQSSAPHSCARTRCWHRWSPTVCSAHFAVSGFSFDRTVRSVRTHGSSTAANVSFDSQSYHFSLSTARNTAPLNITLLCVVRRRRQRLKPWTA
jgi:hypothetical protein